jgi:C4-dicarboxylate-specific signal transduction histidine kinase
MLVPNNSIVHYLSLYLLSGRPCDLSVVLEDLVGAAQPLAFRQQRTLDVTGISHPLQVAVEESALRQALSNLIEGALLRTQLGGRVQIYAGEAPAGGILVVIDDDGPDMQYMTQMHCLAPFGSDLADGMHEDNMTWNFIAGLTVARDILENYGCVLRVISPRRPDAIIGTGGSRIEIWLPTSQTELSEITEGA